MLTRIVFLFIALALVVAGVWAYHHDQMLDRNAALVNLGDPNETVRELLGEPSGAGDCGLLTMAPQSCATEYVYRYYYSIFRPQYEVVWFDHAGKVIGEQHVERSF
jgi:hypothetical protein